MSRFSVSKINPEVADMLDRAVLGDELLIEREGHESITLRVVATTAEPKAGSLEWLVAGRDKLPHVNINSVELMRLVYEDYD